MALDPNNKINVGSAENPIWVPAAQISDPNSKFWRGVAEGGVVVGQEHGGIDLDQALRSAQQGAGQGNVNG